MLSVMREVGLDGVCQRVGLQEANRLAAQRMAARVVGGHDVVVNR
jgi:hypothetical protein